jgi:hypothetical protein
MGRTLFILRAYNDVDHIVPLIWKCTEEGEQPLVVFHTALDFESDYRIQLLRQSGSVEIVRTLDENYERFTHGKEHSGRAGFARRWYARRRNPRTLAGQVYRRFWLRCDREIAFLRDRNVSRCIFEWSTPFIRGDVVERLFTAARGIGLPTFCLPHGCNIYTHPDVNESYRRSIRAGRIPDAQDRGLYDYYVFQNPTRRDMMVRWGYDPVRTQAWGSLRFDPEWQRKNLAACPPFSSAKEPGDRLRVVFMHHQRNYNLHIDRIWHLLGRLAEQPWIHLVVKWSTRSGTEYPSQAFLQRHGSAPNVEVVRNGAHSPALIDWSDAVINFGSSIGIEALLQGRPTVVPTHLHDNRTLYEFFGAGLIAADDESVLAHLRAVKEDGAEGPQPEGVQALYREVIYGGREPHDVLAAYHERITDPRLRY